MKKVLIIIPAYNEQANISRVIHRIRAVVPDGDILVVDDGSMDATPGIARESGCIVLSLPYNLGYGGALQTGFKYAYKNHYDIVVQMDADGQHDPSCIKDLICALDEGDYDVIIGSRFLGKGDYKTSLIRRVGMLLFGAVASLVIRQRVSDPTSGFQAINSRVIRFFSKGDHYPVDYPDTDVVILLKRAGFRVSEIPVKMHPRASGKGIHDNILGPIFYIFKMFLSILVVLCRKLPKTATDERRRP